MRLEVIDEPFRDREWDEFVAVNDGTVFHLSAWSIILNKIYGFKPFFTKAYKSGELIAILPMFELITIFGRIMRVPFFSYSNMILQSGLPKAERRAVVKRIVSLLKHRAKALRARMVEIRGLGRKDDGFLSTFGFHEDRRYKHVTFILDLHAEPEALFRSLRKSVRWSIRKARRSGVRVLRAWGTRALNAFYHIYLRKMKELGTPPHPKSFFRLIAEELGHQITRLYLAVLEGKVIAAAIFYKFAGKLHYAFSASLAEYKSLHPVSLILWSAIEDGIREGARLLDFGRTRIGTGVFEFKKRWNGTLRRLPVYVLTEKPERALFVDPGNPMFLKLATWWSKVVPLPVAANVGWLIRRFVGW